MYFPCAFRAHFIPSVSLEASRLIFVFNVETFDSTRHYATKQCDYRFGTANCLQDVVNNKSFVGILLCEAGLEVTRCEIQPGRLSGHRMSNLVNFNADVFSSGYIYQLKTHAQAHLSPPDTSPIMFALALVSANQLPNCMRTMQFPQVRSAFNVQMGVVTTSSCYRMLPCQKNKFHFRSMKCRRVFCIFQVVTFYQFVTFNENNNGSRACDFNY